MVVQDWSISGAAGMPVLGTTHSPEAAPVGLLLLLHGFKGYKDYAFFPRLAEQAAALGLVAVRFNFSHSGMTNNLGEFERPDLFERDTWSKQIEDVAAVVKYLRSQHGEELPMVWFGHSRGAVTALLAAARAFHGGEYPPGPEISAPVGLVTAAAPHRCCNLTQRQCREMKKQGYIQTPSSRTKQNLRVGLDWLLEIQKQPEAFDPLLAASYVECPMLIVHGGADQTVSLDSAEALARVAAPRAQLEIVPGGTHTFSCPNPLPSGPEPLPTQRLITLTCGFARQRALDCR